MAHTTPSMKELAESLTVTKGERSSATITGEIPYAVLTGYRAAALEHLGKNVSIDGFRKGHVPEAMLVERIGEMPLLSEMAERTLAKLYPEILRVHTLDAIGQPQVSITKLAPENPLGFSIQVALMPEITLPDYKQLASGVEHEAAEVTDEDVTKQIEDIQRSKRAYERMQEKATAKREAEAAGQTLPTPESVQDTETPENDADEPLPELTDEYVKTLGEFSSVEEFKTKLREHLSVEKTREAAGKHRAAITDALVEASTIELPEVLVASELSGMFGQMEQDLTRANLSIDDYLTHLKKTRKDLEDEWRPAAEKRAKLQLILNEIAKREAIEIPEEELEAQVQQILEAHKDADPTRVRLYVRSTLENERVLKMLEEQSEKKAA